MNEVTIAIASDIHAGAGGDSYVPSEPPDAANGEHPLADLLRYTSAQGITADYLICPGDISNRADATGKVYGWKRLHELAKSVKAGRVIATPGNHDLTTRIETADRTADLRNLVPSYPTGDATDDKVFWDLGIVLIELPEFRLIVLDSCRGFPPHPGASASKAALDAYYADLDRGYFTKDQEKALETILAGLDERAVNIFLCHHHPIEHERHDLFKDTYGPMHRGDQIVRLLEKYHQAGRWLIIHGHKHVPRLINTGGASANSPLLFCAASIGGKLWHPVVSVTRNQFHLLKLELDPVPGLGRLRGSITSYMWGFGAGWKVASRENAGMPPRCGFGASHDHRDLAEAVVTFLDHNSLEFASWAAIADALPALRYQGPSDLAMFEEYLDSLEVILVRGPAEQVLQVARKVPSS